MAIRAAVSKSMLPAGGDPLTPAALSSCTAPAGAEITKGRINTQTIIRTRFFSLAPQNLHYSQYLE